MKFLQQYRRLFVIVTIITVLLQPVSALATQSRSENFSTAYSLSESQQDNLVDIAMAQLGKRRGDLKYTEAWCADFVSDCAKLAGITAIIPTNGLAAGLYSDVLAAGGKVVKKPQKGDLVFYYCKYCRRINHVGIMINSVQSVEGNYSSKVSLVDRYFNDSRGHSVASGAVLKKYVRPAYQDKGSWNVSTAVLKEGTSTTVLSPVLSSKAQVSFISSNNKVVSVDKNCRISARRSGTAFVTAVSKNGKTASVKIRVQKTAVKTEDIRVESETVQLNIGDTYSINAEVSPITSEQKMSVSSSAKKIVSVDKYMKLTAVAEGQAVITVKSGNIKKSVSIVVVDNNKEETEAVTESVVTEIQE